MKDGDKSIVFLGDSLTAGGDWTNEFPDFAVHNLGVPGDTSSDIIKRINQLKNLKPHFLFAMMGVNDFGEGKSADEVITNWKELVKYVRTYLPDTKLVAQSILPFNKNLFFNPLLSESRVIELNNKLLSLSSISGMSFINLYENYIDDRKMLDAKYTDDGLHLNIFGYKIWYSEVRKFLSKYKNEAL